MAKGGNYAVTITAVDQATAKIDAINKQLEKLRAPSENFHKSLAKLSDLTGIKKIGEDFNHMREHMVRGLEVLSRFVPALGAVAGAGIVASLGEMYKSWANLGVGIRNTTALIGGSVAETEEMRKASLLAGYSANTYADAVMRVQDVFRDAKLGKNPMANFFITEAGIDTTKTGLNAIVEITKKLNRYLGPNADPAARRRLFGMFNLTPDVGDAALEAQNKAAKYPKLTKADNQLAVESYEANMKLSFAFEHLGQVISVHLAPHLIPLIERFETWLIANDKAGGGIDKTIEKVEKFGAEVDDLVQKLGGWEVVGGAFILLLTGKWIARTITGIGEIGVALLKLKAPAWVTAILALYAAKQAHDFVERLGSKGDQLVTGRSDEEQKEFERKRDELQSRGLKDILEWLQGLGGWLGFGPNKSGAAGSPGSGGPGGVPTLYQNKEQEAVDLTNRFAKDLNLTVEQAAGITSQAVAESGLEQINERNPEKGRGGYGYFQHTDSRRVGLEAYARKNNLVDADGNPTKEASIRYAELEFQTTHKGVLDSIRKTTTAYDSANAAFPFESGNDPKLESQRAGHVANAERIAKLTNDINARNKPPIGQTGINISLKGAPHGTQTNVRTNGPTINDVNIVNPIGDARPEGF